MADETGKDDWHNNLIDFGRELIKEGKVDLGIKIIGMACLTIVIICSKNLIPSDSLTMISGYILFIFALIIGNRVLFPFRQQATNLVDEIQ